jgi:hypothetical protein
LLWRDFFYAVSFGTPNFDQMKGNKICKQVCSIGTISYTLMPFDLTPFNLDSMA